jgi:hypothetical protein
MMRGIALKTGRQNEKAFPEGDPLPFALMAWSVVHGIAELAVSGHLS